MGKTSSKPNVYTEPETTVLNKSSSSISKEEPPKRQHSRKKIDKSRPDDYVFYLVIIGESGVGKTSIVNRFTNDTFSDQVPPTVGVNFEKQSVMVDNNKIGLEIWDVSGEERTRVPTSYYQGCKGFLAVYDVSNKDSFQKIEKWVEDCNKLSGPLLPDNAKFLVGNKIDKKEERQVSSEEALKFATRMNSLC